MKPGGWAEQIETTTTCQSDDGSMPADGAVAKWAGFYDEIGEKIGITFRAAEASCQAMKDAGFINVRERIIKLPVGPWAKDKQLKAWGAWFGYFILHALDGFVLRMFTEVLKACYDLRSSIYSFQFLEFTLTNSLLRIVVLRGSASLHCPGPQGAQGPADSCLF